jgi:hypothetical protein
MAANELDAAAGFVEVSEFNRSLSKTLPDSAIAVQPTRHPDFADAAIANRAHAKGCIKGAIVGGVARHYAGHHGVIGAMVGCAIGHHEPRKH